MSICNSNINKTIFNESVILEDIKRDYGLTNINNINHGVEICTEIFNWPTFTSNFTKLVTGLTETSLGVFIITGDSINFTYTFTGNTDTLTAYTGNFQYKIFPRNPIGTTPITDNITGQVTPAPEFSSNQVYSANTTFSAITSSGFTYIETIPTTQIDQEFIFNSNFDFLSKNCLFKQNIQTTNLENIYDENYSLYFVTLFNPPTPILGPFQVEPPKTPRILTVDRVDGPEEETYIFGIPQEIDIDPKCQLVTENLTIGPVIYSSFTLTDFAINNSLMVSVNGITLSELDYSLSNGNILNLSQNLDPNKDILSVTYLVCDKPLTSIKSEKYLITGITSGTTSSYVSTEKVYYNTDHNSYEYYTNYEIVDEVNILLFLNGVKLTYGFDYYVSVSVNNRLIFNSNLNIGDIIYVIYDSDRIVSGDYNFVNTPNKVFEWLVTTPTLVNQRNDGNFIVEFTTSLDPTFSSTATTKQILVEYIDNNTLYSTQIPTGLTTNNIYIWRVTNNKVYYGLNDNIFTTTNISKVGKFSLGNGINSY